MWAHRLTGPGRLEGIAVRDLTPEVLQPGEVLLRSMAGGICGSDIPHFRGVTHAACGANGVILPNRVGFPMHEVVGEVVATRDPGIAAGACVVGWAGQSEGLAEYVVCDGEQIAEYDRALPPSLALVLQPLACVLFAAGRLDVRGKRVAVLGLGPIGLLFAHVLKASGAAHVTGVDPVDRVPVARRFGLDESLQTTSRSWAECLNEADRPDVVIEAVGHQISTLEHAVAAVADSGWVSYFGVPDDRVYPINMEQMVRRNLTLVAGVTRDCRRMLRQAGDYVGRHPELPGDLVTHRFAAADAQQAYEVAAVPAFGRLKVVLEMAEQASRQAEGGVAA